MNLLHWKTEPGLIRIWRWTRSEQLRNLLEISTNGFGFRMTIEFPSTWHEDQDVLVSVRFGWPGIYLSLPWYRRYPDDDCSGPRFGAYWIDRELWLLHGRGYYTVLYSPWSLVHVRHEVQRPDGSWVPHVGAWEKAKEPDGRWVETYPYRYTLKSGKIQDRIATVYVEEREWRWRWFQKLAWPRKIHRSINVDFSDEVGERSGSWKGGTIGCGYDLMPEESAEDCLRRMELERKF